MCASWRMAGRSTARITWRAPACAPKATTGWPWRWRWRACWRTANPRSKMPTAWPSPTPASGTTWTAFGTLSRRHRGRRRDRGAGPPGAGDLGAARRLHAGGGGGGEGRRGGQGLGRPQSRSRALPAVWTRPHQAPPFERGAAAAGRPGPPLPAHKIAGRRGQRDVAAGPGAGGLVRPGPRGGAAHAAHRDRGRGLRGDPQGPHQRGRAAVRGRRLRTLRQSKLRFGANHDHDRHRARCLDLVPAGGEAGAGADRGAGVPVRPRPDDRELVPGVFSEHVLCVSREDIFPDGAWHGFVDQGLDRAQDVIRHRSFFMPRAEVEEDPRYQQIIPYVVFRHGERYLLTRRLKASGEKRLHQQYSLGVGGHINPGDLENGDPIDDGMRREWAEEVEYQGHFQARLLGLINDDSAPVSEVHLGLVFLVAGDGPEIAIRETDRLGGELLALPEMRIFYLGMESWSQIVYDHLLTSR